MTEIKVGTFTYPTFATYGYPYVPDPFDPRIQILPQGVKPPIVALNEAINNGKNFVVGTSSMYFDSPLLYNDGDLVGDNFMAQKDITKHLLYRVLDKWLFEDKMSGVLKFLKYENGKVRVVKSLKEAEENKISKDTEEILEKKADFIEENYLGMEKMRKLLIKVTQIGGIRWYMLPYSEHIVVDTIKKYLKKKLTEGFPSKE